MDNSGKGNSFTYHDIRKSQPHTTDETTVETQENEATGTDMDIEVDIYNEDVDDFYIEVVEQPSGLKLPKADSHCDRKNRKMERIAGSISSVKVDAIEVGTSVILATSDRTLTHPTVDKAVKNGIAEATFLGDISIEALVEGMLVPSAADGRFAMLGTSVMWNALKSNIRDLKSSISEQTAQSFLEPRFDGIDLQLANVPNYERSYRIQAVGVFSNADLGYVYSLLKFRTSAKLLNKTKQFLKAYFIVACRPRCMIWRYTLRRSGNSHKKAILNLPQEIIQTVLTFLIDLTGIGDGSKPLESLNRSTPFYHSLGEDEAVRQQRYYEACKLKDLLMSFFRETITDCLNEIREMPFCLNTGTMISPLRGRSQRNASVMWKDYESYLKTEHDLPSEANMKKRIAFEQKLCDIVPRGIHVIRR
ncbi:hypothetical protein CRE_04515 [Caenorhabditis remanei]|uniref:Uncharacterized protein n=1 Tax=Caenorhabditis remanei TaxID=31234 RepID=E3LYT4_CAERE|nr:hypothetical protein CRE_04515 [Caenorhabditis remanei]